MLNPADDDFGVPVEDDDFGIPVPQPSREQAYYATQQAVQQGLVPDPRGPSSSAIGRFAQGVASGANKLLSGAVASGAEIINSLASINAARNPADVRAQAEMMRLQAEVAGKPLPPDFARDPMAAAAESLRQQRRPIDTKTLIRDMDRAIDLAFPTDDSKASVAGQIAGNVAGRIGSIVVNPALGVAVGGLGTGGEGVREAIEMDKLGAAGSDANILASSLVDGVLTGIGISRGRQLVDELGGDLVDRLLRFATKAKGSGNAQLAQKGEQIRRLLAKTGVAMGTGAAENVLGEVAINRIAQQAIGSDRGTFDGAGIAAGLGAAFPLAGGVGRYLASNLARPSASPALAPPTLKSQRQSRTEKPTLKSQQEARTKRQIDVDAEAQRLQQEAVEAAELAEKQQVDDASAIEQAAERQDSKDDLYAEVEAARQAEAADDILAAYEAYQQQLAEKPAAAQQPAAETPLAKRDATPEENASAINQTSQQQTAKPKKPRVATAQDSLIGPQELREADLFAVSQKEQNAAAQPQLFDDQLASTGNMDEDAILRAELAAEQDARTAPEPDELPQFDDDIPFQRVIRQSVAGRVANAPPDAAVTQAPSIAREMEKLVGELDSGNITASSVVQSVDTLIQQQRQARDTNSGRGADWLREKILQAKRSGDVPQEGAEFALWLLGRAPHLADDLAINIRQPEQNERMIRGMYSRVDRMITLLKGAVEDRTAVHELLHHAERFMPLKVQDAIRREWLRRVLELQKAQRDTILRANQGDADAKQMLSRQVHNGIVPYELANASEFWAHRATELLASRFKASGSVWMQAHRWIQELIQTARGLLGLKSDAPMIRALNALLKETPEDASGALLSSLKQLRSESIPGQPASPSSAEGHSGIPDKQLVPLERQLDPLLEKPGMTAVGANVRMERPGVLSKLREIAKSIRNQDQQSGFRMTWADKFLKYVTNDKQAIDAAVRYLANGKPVVDSSNPVVLAALEAGTDSMAELQLRFGLMNTRDPDGIKPMLDSLGNPISISYLFPTAIRGDVKTMKKWLSATVEYGIAQRTIDLAARLGRDTELTGIGKMTGETDLEVAVRVLREVRENPQIERVLEESLRRYREFADALLVKLRDAGYISQERLDGYRKNEKYYIDLERVMDDAEGIKLLAKIEGSDRMIDNPYVSLISMLGRVEKAIARNDAKKALVDMAIALDRVGSRPEDLIIPVAKAGENTIEVRRDGNVEHWAVPPDIKEAFDGYINNSMAIRAVGAVLGVLGRLKRELIAQSPKFISNNVVRDFIDRLIVTQSQPGILAGFKGTDKLLNPKEFSKAKMELLLSGGGNSTLLSNTAKISYDRLWNREIRKIAAEGDAKRTIVMLVKRFPFQWRKVSEGSEYINRVTEFASAKEYATEVLRMSERDARIYAADKARKILDFARMGKAVRAINTIIYQPFLNASIQGLARDIRLMRTKPGAISARYALFILTPEIVVRSLSEMLASEETKERLKNMSDFRRFGAWNIGMGDWIISIPKPFMWAAMTAPVTAAMDAYWNQAAVNFRGIGQAFVRALVPPLGVDVVPGAIEVAANYNFFTGRNIVPPNETGLDISLRNTESASALGTRIADFIRGIGLDATKNLDPRYVDAYLQAQGGGTAQMVMALSDLLEGAKPDRGMRAVGSVTSFVTVPAAGSAPVIQRLNERAARVRDDGSKDVQVVRSLLRRASKASTLADRNRLLDAAYKAAERGNEFYDRHEATLLEYRQATQEINRIRTELSRLPASEQAAYVAANRQALQASARLAKIAQALGNARSTRFEAATEGRDTKRLDDIIEKLLKQGIEVATAAQK